MNKKVLHLLSSNKFSGAENVVCQIIDIFKDDNIKMAYCSPRGEIEDVLLEKKIKYLPIKKLSYLEVNKIIKEYNPDIIHAHDFRASILAASLNYKGKLISHLHQNPPFIKKWCIKSFLYYLFMRKFDKIMLVSKAILDEAVFFNKANSKKTIIINNYIDKDKLMKKSIEYNLEEDFDIVFVGRLTEAKNPLRLLKIIKEIHSIKNDVKAIIIGDGELKVQCEKFAFENQMQNYVSFKGFLSNPFPYLKKAKVSLMPSTYEGFGLVAIESMILETPVLNSGCGGLYNIFENEPYFICNDTEEYVKKTLEILNGKSDFVFEKIILKYTNRDRWRTKLKEIYQ